MTFLYVCLEVPAQYLSLVCFCILIAGQTAFKVGFLVTTGAWGLIRTGIRYELTKISECQLLKVSKRSVLNHYNSIDYTQAFPTKAWALRDSRSLLSDS